MSMLRRDLRVRGLAVAAGVALVLGVTVHVSAAAAAPARKGSVCDQAIAQAGTGKGKYGHYRLVRAPAQGGSGSDVVVGTNGPDHLVGGSGNDVLCGLGGDDVLDGGSGNDYLDGGTGRDTLHGGPGNDTLVNGEINDGGPGNDKITPGAGSSAPVDISSSMPQAARDEITGDFRNLGYQQRMRAEGTNLNIYDAATRGGGLLSNPAAQDLSIPQSDNGQFVYYYCGDDSEPTQTCSVPTWATSGDYSDTFHLNTIYLAQNGQNIFMTGVTGSNLTVPGTGIQGDYKNELYVLPPDGSCGSASCAQAVVQLPTLYNPGGFDYRAIAASSLAAGTANGRPMVAVGLTDGGLQLYDMSSPRSPWLAGTWGGMATGDGSQTPVTALAFDPAGSGMLSVGVISSGNIGYVIRVQQDGTVGGVTTWAQTNGGVLSTAFGQRGDGSPVVAYGPNDQTLRVIDPANTGTVNTIGTGQADNVVVAINPVPRFWGIPGGSDFAVAEQTTPGILEGHGSAFRWDGSSPSMTALNVSAGSTPTMTSDWEAFRSWYPGIKEGRLVVANSAAEPVTVTLQTDPDSSSGCWYAPDWADASAFPSTGLTLAAGQTSTQYTIGAYTSGSDGQCAAGGDAWRGYLVVTPVTHPADQRLVRLLLNPDMSVDVASNQAGGTTTAAISLVTVADAAFGRWQLTVGTPAAPGPQTAPTVAAARVTTAAMTSGPPVYRFDVTGATLTLPGSYADQMTLPPLVVQGSTNNGTTWTNLGSIVPSVAPTITPQGNGTALLQLGPSTFWWENPAGSPAYTQIRVGFGTGGPQSAVVTLANLPTPTDPPSTSSQGPQVTVPGGIAQPVNSGIDQAPLSVQVLDTSSNVLPVADPHYARIYYRQKASNALITGLVPPTGTPDLVTVTPYAGAAYANNGDADTGAPGVFQGYHYVATTSTQDQKIVGYLSYGDGSPLFTQDIEIKASAIDPKPSGLTLAVDASLSGCSDFTGGGCLLAGATPSGVGSQTPVLYTEAGSATLTVGLLNALQATSSTTSLPLQHPPSGAAHLLATSPLNVSAGSAKLDQPDVFATGDTVDSALVAHGVLKSFTMTAK
jgi:RTX calcium-binding nonapeptide repeat (4 copies)